MGVLHAACPVSTVDSGGMNFDCATQAHVGAWVGGGGQRRHHERGDNSPCRNEFRLTAPALADVDGIRSQSLSDMILLAHAHLAGLQRGERPRPTPTHPPEAVEGGTAEQQQIRVAGSEREHRWPSTREHMQLGRRSPIPSTPTPIPSQPNLASMKRNQGSS